ncbi:MAG: PAS domain S-box protein, partial [Methanoregula sp.]
MTIAAIGLTLVCFLLGINTVFMHLYYLPIILIAYFYSRRGIPYFTGLAILYLALAMFFLYSSTIEIEAAILRTGMFILIGLVVAELSERLVKKKESYRIAHEYEKSIIDNANVWLMVLDSNGQVLGWNRAAEKISGYPAAEVIGDTGIWKRLYPEKMYRREITRKITEIIQKDNYLENMQTTIVSKNGTKKTIVWNTRGLPDDGVVGSYIAIGVDITDRENIGQISREYADWYSTLLRTTQDGYHLVDASGRLIEVNDNYCRMTGFSREELLGKSISELDADENNTVALAHLQKILATGSDRFDARHRTKSGGTIDVEISAVLQSQKKQFIVFIRDITGRKRAEKALLESEEKFRAFFTTSQDCVFITSADGHWIDSNTSAAEFFGFESREELMRGNIADLYAHPDDRIAHLKIITELGFSKEFPVDLRKKDGTIIHALVTTAVRKDQNGNLIGFQGTIRDITELKRAEAKLQELASVVRYSGELIGIVTLDKKISFLNDAGARMLGILPADAIGEDFFRYVSDHLKEKIQNEILPSLIEHGTWSGDLQYKNQKTGKPVDVHAMTFTIADPATGKPQFMANISLDITDRKRAEEALRSSQIQLTDAMNLALIAHWEYDVLTGIFTFNDRFYALFATTAEREGGYQMPAEVYSREFVHPDDANVVFDEVQKAIAAPDPDYTTQIEHRIIRRDGEVRHIIVRFRITKDAEGRTVKTHGANQDITERKRMEEALYNSQQILRSVLDTIPVRVFWKDRNLKFLGCNEPFARDAGFHKPEELIGKDDYQMGWRDQAKLYRADDQLVIDTGKTKILSEEPQTTPDGRTIWLLTSKTPLRNSSGGINGVLGAYVDISERKRMEDALRQVNKQLNILSSITRHDILNQLMGLKGYLFLSHEVINNPAILAGYIEKEEQVANAIEHQITFTRDYQELGTASPEWQNVNANIEKAVLGLPMRDVRVEVDPKNPEIFADRLFEKVFYNLIDNALNYGGAGMKTIRVSSQEIEGSLLIVCEDDGVGISA